MRCEDTDANEPNLDTSEPSPGDGRRALLLLPALLRPCCSGKTPPLGDVTVKPYPSAAGR